MTGADTLRIIGHMDGKTLKAIRARLGLTQEQLAEHLGVARNSVARWERDEIGMKPSTEKLILLIAKQLEGKKK